MGSVRVAIVGVGNCATSLIQGVEYYNQQKGKDVSVLGWNAAKQDGTFVQSDKPFEDVKGGGRAAQGLTSQGADVIFPVAGPAGEGALQTAKASGGKVNAIWVDTDGCVSAPNYCAGWRTEIQCRSAPPA